MNNPETPSLFSEAQAVLETLKSSATREAKKKNLHLLWTVLTDMHRSGLKDYSLALVGRRLEAAGGPKTQSLRNEGGKDFRKLIVAFIRSLGAQAPAAQQAGRSQLEIAIDTLPDVGVRALFRQIVAESKLLRSQNDQLRSAFKGLAVSAPKSEQNSASIAEDVITLPVAGLAPLEKDILRRSISDDRFAENGWKVKENGSVVDDTGVVVLPPGLVPLIKRLAE